MSANNDNHQGEGRLTTHVLDTASGKPAANLKIELYSVAGGSRELIKSVETNADGRCDVPLLQTDEFTVGDYELVFDVGDYFQTGNSINFLGLVPVRFGVGDASEHYHVPLLVSPYGYSTYRGS